VKRCENEDLHRAITYMLHEIDHPFAVKFTVEQMALALQRLEGSGGFSPFVLMVPVNWRRHHEEGVGMSASSRRLLLDYWTQASTDKYLRDAAFRRWAATERPKHLDILRSPDLPGDLSDSILRERLARHDQSAIPQLLAKLQTEQRARWWHSATHVWSTDLLSALDTELTRSGAKIAPDGNADFDFVVADLIIRLPPETREALLEKHWDHLRFSGHFVQTALYLATPKLLDLAAASLQESPNPEELLKYLGQHFGIRTTGHPGITREGQVEAIVPYLALLPTHEVMMLWDLSNKHGWYRLRREHLDPLIRENRALPYFDHARAMGSLDELVERKRAPWIDHWLEDYAETGASTDAIIGLLGKWFASRKTMESLQLVSRALSLVGRRDDLAILNVKLESDDASVDMLRADIAFAVRRRTLR
jgi:hypothetical protein